VQGICRAYRVAKFRHTAYNIACGRSYTVAEVVDVLRRVAPEVEVSVGSGQWDDDPYQALNLRGPLDITRAREDLRYAPRYALAEGLTAYIAWWRAAGR
jgi:UDP-glucose 4-epimerase